MERNGYFNKDLMDTFYCWSDIFSREHELSARSGVLRDKPALAIEIAVVYGATRVYPKCEKQILVVMNTVCLGFIYSDHKKGIGLKLRF